MSNEITKQPPGLDLAEFKKLLGPPPVLSTESVDAYYGIMAGFIDSIKPNDFMKLMLVKDLTDAAWEVIRATRHKAWAVERKDREWRETQARRTSRDTRRKELQEALANSKTEIERFAAVDSIVDHSFSDMDKTLSEPPHELDHARSMEAAITYYERLNVLQGVSSARSRDILDQILLYDEVVHLQERRLSSQPIDAEFTETVETSPTLAPPKE